MGRPPVPLVSRVLAATRRERKNMVEIGDVGCRIAHDLAVVGNQQRMPAEPQPCAYDLPLHLGWGPTPGSDRNKVGSSGIVDHLCPGRKKRSIENRAAVEVDTKINGWIFEPYCCSMLAHLDPLRVVAVAFRPERHCSLWSRQLLGSCHPDQPASHAHPIGDRNVRKPSRWRSWLARWTESTGSSTAFAQLPSTHLTHAVLTGMAPIFEEFVYPVRPNPHIHGPVYSALGGLPHVIAVPQSAGKMTA